MKKIFATILVSCAILAGCSAGPQVQWESFGEEKMAAAVQSGRPAVIYFYAAWCGACYQLKEQTFSDARVIEALEPFVRLKADLSFSHSEKIKRVAAQYRISGVPTVILFDETGRETVRFSGFVSAGQLLEIIGGLR